MKKIKGCLLYLIASVFVLLGVLYLVNHKLQNDCLQDHQKVKKAYTLLQNKLMERNKIIKISQLSEDIKSLATSSDSILKVSSETDDFIWLEYEINDKTRHYENMTSIHLDLNKANDSYTKALRHFNNKWKFIPYNFVLLQLKLPNYTYFEIEFGGDNLKNIENKKAAEHFIETGEFPI